jgi:thiamine biosynthesis protein ThiS
MKKIKKIKIKVNGQVRSINDNTNLLNLVKSLRIPLNKVAIELNLEIIDKKKLNKKILKKDDKIEIVHFIGGG